MVRRRRRVVASEFLPPALLTFDPKAWPGGYAAYEAAVRAHVASEDWLRVNVSFWLRAIAGVRAGRRTGSPDYRWPLHH